MKKIAIAAILVAASALAWAHSGGTDKWGCHVESSTGMRHCH